MEAVEVESKVNLLIRNVIGVGVSVSVLVLIVAIGVIEYITITNLPLQPPYLFIGKTTLDKFYLPSYCPAVNNTQCCEPNKQCNLQFENPQNISMEMTVVLAMQNINPTEVFRWKDIATRVSFDNSILLEGSLGNGTMKGLSSSEIPLKLKFNQNFVSLKKVLCSLDQKENPSVNLVVGLVDFIFANETYARNLTQDFKLDLLPTCQNTKQKCEIDPTYRKDICGDTKFYTIEQLLSTK